MSLKTSNLATAKQIVMLHNLDYYGRGQYVAENLNVAEAADLISELLEEDRLANKREVENMGNLADLLDPFNQINK